MQKKNFIYAALCVCVVVMLSGCGSFETDSENPLITPEPKILASDNPDENKNPTVAPVADFEITIYTLKPENLEKEAVTVLVEAESELSPELIIEQVVDAMEEEGFFIGINEILLDGDNVIVDFKSNAAPVCNVGAAAESAILDSIGQSILDNLTQYKNIIFRIEGNAYKTGHLEFGLNEVYIGK